ncbi:hypothetical protein NDN08_007746 [Rhodosorus marinus]|uniref:Anaphase-promoting complex subunit 4 WD40 domain-containing protein n=1 Tax=Rhodosorus marinus TaxID=101924 RepID=A0AAV8V208_9RHOD|nr:hypothetical protein NDN08_007746 [Rhodosorus marinus]
MEFSDTIDSTCQAKMSWNGELVAGMEGQLLVIRNTQTAEDVQAFQIDSPVRELKWSPDSELVMCINVKSMTIDVRSVCDPEWKCTITEGYNHICDAVWGPDSRCIVSIAKADLRATVWSLVSVDALCDIPGPRHGAKGINFRSDGSYAAVASRKSGRDLVTIYDTVSWRETASFDPLTKDLAGLSWSPDGHCLAVWDSRMEYFLGLFTANGILLNRYTAYRNALGVVAVEWSALGEMIAVASCDGYVRILATATWRVLCEFEHTDKVVNTVTFKESFIHVDEGDPRIGYNASDGENVITLRDEQQKQTSSFTRDFAKLEWNSKGTYIACVDSAYPNVVQIWDIRGRQQAAVIVQRSPVTDLKWDISSDRLGLCTANSYLYSWRPEGSSCISLPLDGFSCRLLDFSWNGDCIMLQDRDTYTLGYDVSASG